MKNSWKSLFVCCMLLSVALPTVVVASEQQEANDHPSSLTHRFHPGQLSLSVGLPNGNNPFENNAFGLWFALHENLLLGAQLGLNINTFLNGVLERDWSWDLALVPGIRYYFRLTDVISPFLYSHLRLALGDPTTRFVGTKDPDLTLRLAFGGEWFVQPSIGIAAYMGVDLGLLKQSPQRSPTFNTLASGILANLYF